VLLKERSFTPAKITGMVIGLAGLVVIFGNGLELGPHAPAGIEVLLLGVGLHSLSTVLVKRTNASLPGITVATGTLLVTAPLFLVTWLAFDGAQPVALPPQSIASTVYLGVVGSVAGFSLYFYVLRHVTAGAAALVTLVSPVLALVLGGTINNEQLSPAIWLGAALVLGGLVMHQWGNALGRLASR
jgi:drug/metabolite transporter (DMT)-like permease